MASLWDTLVSTVRQHLPSASDVASGFNKTAHSAYQGVADAASGVGHALAHPIDTIEAAPAAAKHLYQKVDQFASGAGAEVNHVLGLPQTENTLGEGTPQQQEADRQAFLGTVNQYKQNYGSWQGFKNHLENHPWQVLGDALMVAGPAEAAIGKAGEVLKAGRAADMAADADEAFGHAAPTGQRQSLVSPTSEIAPPAPDGLPGNGSVRPIHPQGLKRLMGDPDAGALGDEGTPSPTQNSGNVTPMRRMNNRDLPVSPAPLLTDADLQGLPPANRQYLDATASKPVVQDSAAAYQGMPHDAAPANDPFAEAPQDGPRVINKFGNFVEHPVPDDELPGTHVFTYTADNGEVIPHIRMGIEPNGMAEMSIDPFATAKNRIGPAEMRKAMGQLMDQYPDIKGFGGFRRSGAGAGRVQEVVPKAQPNILGDESGKFTPWGKEYEDDESSEGPVSTPFTQKIAQALIDAEPIREKQDAMQSRVRGERFNNFSQRLGMANTAEDYAHSLGALSGEMPKAVYPSIRGQFTPEELNQMYQMVGDNERLSPGAKATGIRGLNKMLSSEGENFGSVPQPSELKVLKQVFPKEVMQALEDKQGVDWRETLSNIMGIPMTMMTTGDISSPFRHAGFFVTRPEFWKALPKMAGDIASPGFYERQMNSIAADPNFENMEKAGVQFTDVSRETPLDQHEEGFQSNLVQQVPGLGAVVKASERGYTGFLNRVRADVFNSMYYKLQDAGVDFNANPKALTDLGKLVNVGTGRGNLGNLGPLTANTLFAPKLLGAKLTQLNPMFYYNLDPAVRMEALKSLAGYIGAVGLAMGVAKLSGHDTPMNPLDPKWGKWNDGNVHTDITGGNATLIKLYSRVAKFLYDEVDGSIHGEPVAKAVKADGKSALTDLEDFGRSKLGPPAEMATNILDGKTVVGDPVDESDPIAKKIFGKDIPYSAQIMEHFTPMVMSDMRKVYDEEGKQGLVKYFAPDMLGAQVNTYLPHEKKQRGNLMAALNGDDMDKAFGHADNFDKGGDFDKAFGN